MFALSVWKQPKYSQLVHFHERNKISVTHRPKYGNLHLKHSFDMTEIGRDFKFWGDSYSPISVVGMSLSQIFH